MMMIELARARMGEHQEKQDQKLVIVRCLGRWEGGLALVYSGSGRARRYTTYRHMCT
jgi:hypothetical protein